jgi:hypothetical protein
MPITRFKLSKLAKTVANIFMVTTVILLFQNCAGQKQSADGSDLVTDLDGKIDIISGTVTTGLDGCGPAVCKSETDCYAIKGISPTHASLNEGTHIQVTGPVSQLNQSEPNTCMGMVSKSIEAMDIQIVQ